MKIIYISDVIARKDIEYNVINDKIKVTKKGKIKITKNGCFF